MAILADFHLHSDFSGDCCASMDSMVQSGLAQGLAQMCFTEHQDFDFPYLSENPPEVFDLNTDSYLYELIRVREKYAAQIEVLFGVELGIQPHITKELSRYAKSFDFDFIIASSHACRGRDPYYPSFFEGRSEDAAYLDYFESIYENIRKFENFDVYGHLDYVVRYGPSKDAGYSYDKFRDILEKILSLLIEKEKGLELNTGGLRNRLREQNPCTDILRRYRELGGEIITVGSDAHAPKEVAGYFKKAADVLTACGFRYYSVFRNRTPEFIRIA